MEIEKMEAGLELDRLVAVEVMGWQSDGFWWNHSDGQRTGWTVEGALGYSDPWSPSTDWAAAGEVLERLVSMEHKPVVGWNGQAWNTAWHIDTATVDPDEWISAETGPLSICRAALVAVRSTATPSS